MRYLDHYLGPVYSEFPRTRICPTCNGEGGRVTAKATYWQPEDSEICETCGGSGVVRNRARKVERSQVKMFLPRSDEMSMWMVENSHPNG